MACPRTLPLPQRAPVFVPPAFWSV